MKKLILILALITFGCAGLQFGMKQDCILNTGEELSVFCDTVAADPNRKSYICETAAEVQIDPCVGYRMIELVAKEGIILEGYTEAEFNAWADRLLDMVKSGTSFGDLKTVVLAQVVKLNRLAGAQLFLFSDMLISLPDNQFITADDVILIESAIIDLKEEVHRMSLFV
jgi:hypothetical protein